MWSSRYLAPTKPSPIVRQTMLLSMRSCYIFEDGICIMLELLIVRKHAHYGKERHGVFAPPAWLFTRQLMQQP